MVYLDYSATTPVNKEVLDSFNKVCLDYIGNANSIHKLGKESFHLMEACVKQVADILKVKSDEVIFTSGATEANNLAIKGVAYKYRNRGNHILTTKLEHSSILETVDYLSKNGFEVEYINILEDGRIDINDLKNKIKKNTILVSIGEVNSEIGIKQNVNEIGLMLKDYPKVFFHVDGTQAVGKIEVDLKNIDLYSFSGHKIYGIKGIGCLIKKGNIELEPIIHGGKSQSKYRSGTPTLAHYASIAKALKLVYDNFNNKYDYVMNLNKKLKEKLLKINNICINSNENSIPHILNISIKGIKAETMLNALAEKDIFISTRTACSDNTISLSVYELTKNKELARSSLRISISYLTTEEELEYFVQVIEDKIKELSFEKGE